MSYEKDTLVSHVVLIRFILSQEYLYFCRWSCSCNVLFVNNVFDLQKLKFEYFSFGVVNVVVTYVVGF